MGFQFESVEALEGLCELWDWKLDERLEDLAWIVEASVWSSADQTLRLPVSGGPSARVGLSSVVRELSRSPARQSGGAC